jgi:hypothetical protein
VAAPGPFIAIRFPLPSLCWSVAILHSHLRRGAVVRLDGDPGLGRVGFDRTDSVKMADERGASGQNVRKANGDV